MWDPERREIRRALTAEEVAFIHNERVLCALDFVYWLERYAWIIGFDKKPTRFTPNVAQRIVLDLWAAREREGLAIWMQQLKARRLGVSTISELAIQHRFQFQPHAACVIASSTPDKSWDLAGMVKYSLEQQPWWLLPEGKAIIENGMPVEFPAIKSALTIAAGNQMTGVGRGATPNVIHLSELMEWEHSESLIDAALMRAIIDTPLVFGILESTGGVLGGWWHRTWEQTKRDFARGRSRMIPVFLPWYVGTDLYPSKADLRARPVPESWTPSDRTVEHAERARRYVLSNPLLFEHLAKFDQNWQMSREQMWFREIEYETAKEKKQLHIFRQELCVAGDMRVSTEKGILRICDAVNEQARRTEHGEILNRIESGTKAIVEISTKAGRRLRVTPDHRIYVPTESTWRAAGALLPGTPLSLSIPVFATKPYVESWGWLSDVDVTATINETWARFLGVFMGDGCWIGDGVSIACFSEDADTIRQVQADIAELTGVPARIERPKKIRMVNVVGNSTKWWEVLWHLGVLDRRIHKKQARRSGYKKRICVPECIWRSPKPVVREFLRGLFEADGHARTQNAGVLLFAKDAEFLRDVQLLLLGFGIPSVVSVQNKRAGDGSIYLGACLRLKGAASGKFYDEIGFISARKQAGARPKTTKALDLADSVVEVRELAIPVDTFDLTVEQTHQFGANGILVHNCADDFEAFQSSNIPIIDPEILITYQERVREPEAVYTILGPEIHESFVIPPRYWRQDLPPVVIRCNQAVANCHYVYQLIPVQFEGYAGLDPDLRLLVWEAPVQGHTYGVGLDCGEGIGQDNTVIEVLREATAFTAPAQVAEWISNRTTAFQAWPMALAVACWYSLWSEKMGKIAQARLAIESFTNGASAQNEIQKRGWGNFHPWKYNDTRRPRSDAEAQRIGIYTNQWFRASMQDMLLTCLSEEAIDLPSPYLIQELVTLERDPKNKTKAVAAAGSHDDRFMAIGFPLFSLHQNKPPAQQFARRKVAYEPRVLGDPVKHPTWQPPAQATAGAWDGRANAQLLVPAEMRRALGGLGRMPVAEAVRRYGRRRG